MVYRIRDGRVARLVREGLTADHRIRREPAARLKTTVAKTAPSETVYPDGSAVRVTPSCTATGVTNETFLAGAAGICSGFAFVTAAILIPTVLVSRLRVVPLDLDITSDATTVSADGNADDRFPAVVLDRCSLTPRPGPSARRPPPDAAAPLGHHRPVQQDPCHRSVGADGPDRPRPRRRWQRDRPVVRGRR